MDNHGVDRVPQWSGDEIQNFLVIRAELDPTFMETTRNRLLWELVSARMDELGFNRSPIQCKCKWKNLVTRYKGCEAMQDLEMRQWAFPFYNEMQIIFNARLQRMTWQPEVEGTIEVDFDDQVPSNDGDVRKRKRGKEKVTTGGVSGDSALVEGIKGVMEEHMKQQMEIEMMWMKAYEEREERRREREMEWRQRMEAVESESLMMMRRWRERDEERKVREEARAERRDALVTALLNKITREGK